MDILLVNSGGAESLPLWQAAFADYAPALDVRWWDDPTVDPARVAYALVWEPEPGRLARYPNLRLILSSGAGVDHITADPAWPRHVGIVKGAPPEAAQRMGEYACLAALCLLRDMKRIIAAQAARRWDYFELERGAPETRAGVMGLGNLGARAAEMLRDLGFRMAGWSRTRKSLPGIESFAGMAELPAFLARTDILICLLPDTPELRGILRAQTLALLPRGAGVVNAGRGPQLVLPDLIAALDAGHLSGAMLDVFDTEPLPPEHPAWTHPRIIVSSHCAALATRRDRARFFAEAIALHARGERPPTLYDPARGY